MKRLLILYSAGSLAMVFRFGMEWASSRFHLFAWTGSTLGLHGFPNFSYTYVVWGGVFASLLMFPPLAKLHWTFSAVILALIPSGVELLYLLPESGLNYLGISKGWGTPIVILLLNLLWATSTAFIDTKNSNT